MAGLWMLSSLFNSVVSFYLTSNISQYGFSVLYQVSSTRHHSRLSGSLNPRGCQVERSHSNGPLLPLLHHVHRQVSTFLLLIQLTSSLRSVLPYTAHLGQWSLNPRGCQVQRSHSNSPLQHLLHHIHGQVSQYHPSTNKQLTSKRHFLCISKA